MSSSCSVMAYFMAVFTNVRFMLYVVGASPPQLSVKVSRRLFRSSSERYAPRRDFTLFSALREVSMVPALDPLATAVGGSGVAGTKLKSTTGWSSGNGDGSYGFAAFPAGFQYSGSFYHLGSYAYFWTATEYSSSNAYRRYFYTGASVRSLYYDKTYAYSVRLVKDS